MDAPLQYIGRFLECPGAISKLRDHAHKGGLFGLKPKLAKWRVPHPAANSRLVVIAWPLRRRRSNRTQVHVINARTDQAIAPLASSEIHHEPCGGRTEFNLDSLALAALLVVDATSQRTGLSMPAQRGCVDTVEIRNIGVSHLGFPSMHVEEE